MKNSYRNPVMVLITQKDLERLIAGGYENMEPIVKLFAGSLTWLLTGITDDGILYGYADLSMGCVEYGPLCHVNEIETLRVGRLFYLEKDRYFTPAVGQNYLAMDSLSGV